jgi:signal transduction histidine kinase/ActR/RegA family two-component response regulator
MRRSIGLLVTSVLLPIIALGGAFGVITLQAQRTAVRTGTENAVRFASVLAATKLGDGMRAVDMIAQSPAFDGPLDADRFTLLARRLRDSQSAWHILSIADPSGRRLIDVPTPIGGKPNGMVVDPESLRRAVITRRPVIGSVMTGPRGLHAFAVRAPVVRDGKVRYVVSAVIPAETVGPLLNFRALPVGWRVAVVDGAGTLVATSSGSQRGVGQRVSASGLESRRSGRPGFYQFERPDGTGAVAAWTPIAGTDWSVHVATPAAAYVVPGMRALALILAVTILCLILLAVLIRLLLAELRQYRVREIAEVQSQRMEALGRLTGGVAHDFNNLLTPILGGLDLLRPRVGGDERALRYVDAAMSSAERARVLVARLLAFSRRQTLSAVDLDLEPLLVSLSDLLERSVGPVAQVRVVIPDGLPAVHADRAQLELAILNLAINARDAMPDGGIVRIAAASLRVNDTADVEPGDYVAIEVADTGTGMDEATLRHAMDPFFTTKPVEKGTGLGLSMVHGFAAQSGGALRLRSEPGVGTVATIVLPRGKGGERVATAQAHTRNDRGGRILLVDDDENSRNSGADILREAGYVVVEASSVAEARRLLSAGESPDAVVTDYLMPHETGAVLLTELSARRPGLPMMLVTGYAETAENIPPTVPRLAKPYRADELLDMLGGIVAGRSEAA